MKLPALFYGTRPKTRREGDKVIRRLERGDSIVAIVDELGGLIRVEDHPGLIIFEHTPIPGPHFRLYQVLSRLGNRDPEIFFGPIGDALFDALVEVEWGVAMLLGTAGGMFFVNHATTLAKGRYRRFLDAAVRCWPVFEAIGPRWSRMGTDGERLLDVSVSLNHVLQACNIDNDTIRADAHLGLPEFLRRHPPRPEEYVPPKHDVIVLRTEEERREFTRSSYESYYRQIVEDFDMPAGLLRQARAGYDDALRAEGFDPAEIDPYWHRRPSKS